MSYRKCNTDLGDMGHVRTWPLFFAESACVPVMPGLVCVWEDVRIRPAPGTATITTAQGNEIVRRRAASPRSVSIADTLRRPTPCRQANHLCQSTSHAARNSARGCACEVCCPRLDAYFFDPQSDSARLSMLHIRSQQGLVQVVRSSERSAARSTSGRSSHQKGTHIGLVGKKAQRLISCGDCKALRSADQAPSTPKGNTHEASLTAPAVGLCLPAGLHRSLRHDHRFQYACGQHE